MKKIKKFYKGLFIYFGVLLIISGVILTVLWNFLKCYEYSEADSVMNKIVSMIQDGDMKSQATKYLGITENPFETEEAQDDYFFQLAEDKEIGYSLITEDSSDNLKAYFITVDDENVIKLELKALVKEGGFGFDEWEIKDAVFLNEYKILVPENSALKVNGKEVSTDYISSSQSMIPGMEVMYENGNPWQIPYMIEYTVSGFIKAPEVAVTHENTANDLAVNDDGIYVYPFSPDETFAEDNTEWIISVAEDYGKYITKDSDFAEIANHLLAGSEVYSNIQTLEIRWYAEHESYEFNNQEVNNYKLYSDKCFSCDVHFQQIIFSGGKPTEYNTDLNWTFVKKNGNWLLAKMAIIAGE